MYKLKNKLRYYFLPENSQKLLSIVCFLLGLLCIPLSIFVMLFPFQDNTEYSQQLIAIFIGLWAINLVNIATYLKKH